MAVITGLQIDAYRLLTLRAMLKLELAGMKRRGRSAYSILKSEFGLRGSRAAILEQLNALREKTPPAVNQPAMLSEQFPDWKL